MNKPRAQRLLPLPKSFAKNAENMEELDRVIGAIDILHNGSESSEGSAAMRAELIDLLVNYARVLRDEIETHTPGARIDPDTQQAVFVVRELLKTHGPLKLKSAIRAVMPTGTAKQHAALARAYSRCKWDGPYWPEDLDKAVAELPKGKPKRGHK